MPALVPTLTSALSQADAQFEAGHIAAARRHYGALLERAQDKSDRATEVIARVMLAWCALRTRDFDGARDAVHEAGRQVDPGHPEAYGRYRRVLVRLAVEGGTPDTARAEALDYLRWAEDSDRAVDALDACLLLAGLSEVAERVEWLERGVDQALAAGATSELGVAYTALGAALDQLDQADEALYAYEQALRWHRELASGARRVIAAAWAVGSAACRTEAWPLARERLEEALDAAQVQEDCADLEAWILADLAKAYDAAGDVVGARHQVVRAMELAQQQELATLWPERYATLLDQARALELR